jgi:L-lactate dehydrogenase (cytochrome)
MSTPLVSVVEIQKHASPDDCWIVVDDVVWDITKFAPTHPGGAESKHARSVDMFLVYANHVCSHP